MAIRIILAVNGDIASRLDVLFHLNTQYIDIDIDTIVMAIHVSIAMNVAAIGRLDVFFVLDAQYIDIDTIVMAIAVVIANDGVAYLSKRRQEAAQNRVGG